MADSDPKNDDPTLVTETTTLVTQTTTLVTGTTTLVTQTPLSCSLPNLSLERSFRPPADGPEGPPSVELQNRPRRGRNRSQRLLDRFAVGNYSIMDEQDRQVYFEALELLDQARQRREDRDEI